MSVSRTIFAELDGICDYIPFVSTVSNLIDLFQKCVLQSLSKETAKNRYWTHIKRKDLLRCFILLVPILGNISILVFDYSKYKKDTARCVEPTRDLADTSNILANLATQFCGIAVSAAQIIPAKTADQQTLWLACVANNAQHIRDLLAKGVSPNFYHDGLTPLVTACQHSTPEIVKLLIESGADVNAFSRMGNSALAIACQRGDWEIVQLLLPKITNIDATGPKGVTPLMLASQGGHGQIVQFLLQKRADPHKKDADGHADAAAFAIFQDRADLLPLLFSKDENVDEHRYKIQTSPFLTPLLYASLVNSVNSAIYLVERSNIKYVDSSGCNALHYASSNVPLLQALLKKSQDSEFVNQKNIVGSTPLHRAIQRTDQPDAALLLLEKGADPFIANKKGEIPLILASEKGFVTVVEFIQEKYKNRITPEIQEQMNAATAAALARRSQTPPHPEEESNLSLFRDSLEAMITGLQSLKDSLSEQDKLGPIPRTGMEILLGRLARPD